MSSELNWLFSEYGNKGDVDLLISLAKDLEKENNLRMAATAYDRAFGLAPKNEDIIKARKRVLDQLAVVEYGITFRYIPAGSFLMGSESGDPDERPIHPVQLSEIWLSETPISWTVYCNLMNFKPPPFGVPKGDQRRFRERTRLPGSPALKLQYHYCESSSEQSSALRHNTWPTADEYNQKPLIAVSWQDAEDCCHRISTTETLYRLPTEAEWEKAARGGLINCRYPWGNEPPDKEKCDFNRLEQFSILPMRQFNPNGYGLYAMSGCVWEWTADWYDANYYSISPRHNPRAPRASERCIRGGSWADCAEAVTVSFRMSFKSPFMRENPVRDGYMFHNRYRPRTPNIGFRICRQEIKPNNPV
ncbi:MAG: formylglycine-generating enzyme family protein [Candidatus Hermodarchaeota archaeon]